MRSHLLTPGAITVIDVAFDTVVDGAGVHGEVISIFTRPRVRSNAPMEITFLIRVD